MAARAACRDKLRCVDCINPAFINDHIISGYRVDLSWWEATKSLFSLHNETLNVWTHLIGFCIFLYLTYWTAYVNPTIHEKMAEFRQSLPQLDQLFKIHHEESEDAAARGGAAVLLIAQFSTVKARWQELTSQYLADAHQTMQVYISELEDAAHEFGHSIKEKQQLLSREVGHVAHELAEGFSHSITDQQARISQQSAQRWVHLKQKLVDAYDRLHRQIDLLSSETKAAVGDGGPPTWPLIVYLLACKICLGCSTVFHLYCAVKGDHILSMTCKLDYAGISVLIAGSYVPVIWYITHLGNYRFLYMALALLLGSCCITFTLLDATSAPKWRTFRTLMYIGFGAFGLVPTAHTVSIFGFDHPFIAPIFNRIAIMCGLYVCGAVMYLLRVPERFSPGKFDVWFHSHQFWHLFVIIAALTHYTAAQDLWQLSHFFFPLQ